MEMVYKNAWVTVAATSASTSEDGFLAYPLRDRMLELRLVLQIRSGLEHASPCPQLCPTSIFVRYMEQPDHGYFENDVEITTWNSRGWTLQERHLAQRILHFSRSQIFLECKDAYRSECGQEIGLMPRMFESLCSSSSASEPSSASSEVEAHQLRGSSNEQNCLARSRLYNWWFQIVADYSSRQLTYGSDKLIAISGIASHFVDTAQQLGLSTEKTTYLCGLWVSFLADCLLWSPEDPSEMVKADPYRAPSWSWAAWDGSVIPSGNYDWDHLPTEPYFDYVGHEIHLTTDNTYGSVGSASLVLRGRLQAITLAVPTDREHRYWIFDMQIQSSGGIMGYAALDCTEYATAVQNATDLFAFAVIRQRPKTGIEKFTACQTGLVLRSICSKGVFERVGAFVLDDGQLDAFEAVEAIDFIMV